MIKAVDKINRAYLKKTKRECNKSPIVLKPGEVFKPVAVKGYGKYQVSNYGRVMGIRYNSTLTPIPSVVGYMRVKLCKNNKSKPFNISRLVALTFLGKPKNGCIQVNHKDGIKSNNELSNLEWNTQSENLKHRYRMGHCQPIAGEDHGNAKFTNKQVRRFRQMHKNGMPIRRIALKFKVGIPTMWKIIRNKRYKKA